MSALSVYLQLLRSRPALARLLIGEFVSGIGDWLYMVAILIVVYAVTDSAVLLGVVGAARVLPFMVLSVPAGVVVDRFDRRMVLLVTDLARGALMIVLALLVWVGAHVALIVAVSIVSATFAVFFTPAISAYLPSLVDEDQLGPANSAWATLDSVAFIIGPALAGLLIAIGGLSLAFLLNAASFGVVAWLLWRLPPAPPISPADTPEPETVVAGSRAVERADASDWRRLGRRLSGPFLLDAATSLVGGGLGVLTVVIAVDVIGAGEEGTGFLNAATGAGGVLAGIFAGALVVRGLVVPVLVGAGVSAFGLMGLAVSGSLVPAMLTIGLAVGGLLVLDVVVTTLVQRAVPDALRGTTMGALQTSSGVFLAAGSLALPILAHGVGIAPVLMVCGLVVAAVGGVVLALAGDAAEARPPLDPERERVVGLPIFAGLPIPRLEDAVRAMERVPIRAGDVIVRQGDPADRFYVIVDGTARVTQRVWQRGRPRTLRRLGPGEVFGERGLLQRAPRSASVVAETDGALLALDGDRFLELVGSGPGMTSRFLDLYRGALVRT